MSDSSSTSVPPDVVEEVHDALAHFYDYAYLASHSLIARLLGRESEDSTLAVQKLRRLLLEAIEVLRPPAGTPPEDAASRPYAVLTHRYVLVEDLDEVERELGLGRRQIQREQRRGLDAAAATLWSKYGPPAQRLPSTQAGTPLWQEISRVAIQQDAFDAGGHLDRALQAVWSLAQSQSVEIEKRRPSAPSLVLGDPSLFRQLLVTALSFVIQLVTAKRLVVCLERQADRVLCSLRTQEPVEMPEALGLPEAVVALAQAQGARITVDRTPETWCLQISLPAANQERTVVIVEDNQDVVSLFSRYLAGHGYRLTWIENSAQAISRIAEIMPQAVVLDVMMRNADGWEVLQHLKADPHLCHTPVIVCSVLDEATLATSLGADAYLRKPTRPAQLLECLARLLPG